MDTSIRYKKVKQTPTLNTMEFLCNSNGVDKMQTYNVSAQLEQQVEEDERNKTCLKEDV